MRQYILLWSSLFVLLASTAVAQDCASIIALSKVVNVIVSDRPTVEQHASRFCDEYRRYRQTGSRTSFGASYRFLSFTSGRSRRSVDEVASRYCSASSDYTASTDTYRQYTESIAPNSHSSYLQCMEMSERGLKFNVSLASILPKEFSLSVSFLSLTQEKSADVAVTPSGDVTCEWNDGSNLVTTVATGSTAILRCNRNDQTNRSYVRLTRVDGFKGEMVLPWFAYDDDGNPVDELSELQARVADHEAHLPPIGAILAFFGRDADLPDGWVVCDGRNKPDDSPITIDANPTVAGIQLPDLRHRFVRGSYDEIDGTQLRGGGVDTVTMTHSHMWSTYRGRAWSSYGADGDPSVIIRWTDGFGNEGRDHYGLAHPKEKSADMHVDYYTDMVLGDLDNRPRHIELRYIIRVR